MSNIEHDIDTCPGYVPVPGYAAPGELRGSCPDIPWHKSQLDLRAIPKCSENRHALGHWSDPEVDAEVLVPARYCESVYCGRCNGLRAFYGEPIPEPNAWMGTDPEPADEAISEQISEFTLDDAESLRAEAMFYVIKAYRSVGFAPGILAVLDAAGRTTKLPDDMAQIVNLATGLAEILENHLTAGVRRVVLDRAMTMACEFTFRSVEDVNDNLSLLAGVLIAFMEGKLRPVASDLVEKA